MSQFIYQTTISEAVFDPKDSSIIDYDTHLPHAKYISQNMCDDWNNAHMEQYYDEILENKIDNAVMKCKENNRGELVVSITFTLKKGTRLTERYRKAIIDQTSAQMSDGWGESFFTYNNIMTAPDGTRFYIY